MVNVPKWKKWTIGELISQTKTTIQTGPFGTVLSASEFVDYGIPVISVREIREGFIRVTDETPCVTDETFSRLGKYALSANDIVFARKGSVDRSAVIPDGAERYFLGSDGIRIRFDERVVNPNLMLYIFQSPSTKQFLIQSSYGTTMAGLNEKILSALEFYLPETIEEQNRIVQVLTDIDKQLTLTEEMIAKKRAIKQGTMQELLTGKKRLPGFSGEWQYMELGKNGTLIRESINTQLFPCDYFWEYSMPAFDNGKTPVKQIGSDMHSNRTVIYEKVLLFNKLNVRQKRIWMINQCRNRAVCSSEFLAYQSDEINLELLAQILNTDEVTLQFVGMSTGTSNSQKRITPNDFLEYKVYLPIDEGEQSAIAEMFVCLDNEIIALEQKLAKYRQIKQGMMQQLLTGKIRLV